MDLLEKLFVEAVLELGCFKREGLRVGDLDGFVDRELRDALVVQLVAVFEVRDQRQLVRLHEHFAEDLRVAFVVEERHHVHPLADDFLVLLVLEVSARIFAAAREEFEAEDLVVGVHLGLLIGGNFDHSLVSHLV